MTDGEKEVLEFIDRLIERGDADEARIYIKSLTGGVQGEVQYRAHPHGMDDDPKKRKATKTGIVRQYRRKQDAKAYLAKTYPYNVNPEKEIERIDIEVGELSWRPMTRDEVREFMS